LLALPFMLAVSVGSSGRLAQLGTGMAEATSSSFFDVLGSSSPPGFAPGFVAGTLTPQAGQFFSFHDEPIA
jgi:hypothetical protein